MILKALYDYYHRCGDLPEQGMEKKEIGFIIVIDKNGKFLRFEDCRIDKNHAKSYLVKQSTKRSGTKPNANYLYDNAAYVLGYCETEKDKDKAIKYLAAFKEKVKSIYSVFPNNTDLKAITLFYENEREQILDWVSQDTLWKTIQKSLSKKYSTFSFRLEGDYQIVAEKRELLQLANANEAEQGKHICLITGKRSNIVKTTTATSILGSQPTAKLVAFQVKSGYDSYQKTKCENAPISKEAEFAYTTALNTLLQEGSRHKFLLSNRTFIFWASSNNEVSAKAEESFFDMLGLSSNNEDDPNKNIVMARQVFESIYSGLLKTTLDDKFYILGLSPNSARIAVVYWSETTLREFAGNILSHFNDMEIHDNRGNDKKPYQGMRSMISAVTLQGKISDATPNLPEAVIKSIFQGLPYPYTLFSSCIRRIRAEQKLTITRAAILKAYLNRLNSNDKKLNVMLDKENTNAGYLCGRLFAILEKIQEDANNTNGIRERYMNAASSTPSSVFATILNLSNHHSEKLNEGLRIVFERTKQEIIDKLPADGFPAHLDLQDQGRFFVGYYHQRQDLFTSKKEQ